MPLTRYQVRNEYSLADPELYKAADKNDPEALLEGVAMAGLVGVLRQLGDLAEFAAGIFHDLHEEVVATASRGHRLRIRVQQLEAEFPSIEKAYLSQTNHSLFLYNAGIDWHADLRKNQNLITRGDLPRSVMDSYEECRGPPRLFLLDKFDIAGAGACLKRYSDPSFFKTELSSSGTKKSEIQKENKARRIRKKGSYWKIRGTPDDFSISHAKLQQLLSEEGNHTDTNVPINHVKLKKRQLNGFLFYSTNGKSYMERFAETHSLEHKAVCESLGSPPRLKLKSSNSGELDSEMHELSTQSHAGTLMLRDRNQIHSPNREEKILEKVMDDRGEDVIEEATLKMFPDPTSDIELEKVPSDVFKVEDKLEMIVVKETKTDGSADGDRSDDVVSEIDNYMDALNTMESEIETDAESRPKNKHGFFNSQRKRTGSNINEEQKELQTRSSDSNSFGNSSASDDATNSFKKGRFSFSYSDSPSSLAENMLSDGDVAAELDPSTEYCDAESVDIASAKLVENEDVLGTRSSDHPVSNGTCNEVSEFPSYMSGLGDASCDSSLTDSTFSLSHSGSEEHANKNQVVGSNAIETSSSFMKDCMFGSSANCIEDSSNLSGDLPRRISDLEFSPKMRDDMLLLESDKENPEGVLDGQIPDESSDDMLHLPTLSILALENKFSDNVHAEMLPKAYSEDTSNSYQGDLTNKELESSHSVSLSTEEQLHGSAEQELEAGSCTAFPPAPGSPTHADLNDVKLNSNNIITSTEENSDRTSLTDHPMTGYFLELKLLEKTNEVPSVELSSTAEMERLNKNVLMSSKDGPVADRLHMNSSDSQGKSDTSLDFSSKFPAPDTANEASRVEFPSQFDDLKSGMIHEEADSDAAIVDHNRFNSLTEDHVNMQEQHSWNVHLLQENISCNGDSGQSKLEITKPAGPEHLCASNTQNEAVIQTSVSSTDRYIELSNPESFGPEGSELLNDVHNLKMVEHIDGHFHLSDGTKAATLWGEGNEELINRRPQSDLSENAEDAIWTSCLLPDPEAPSREPLELPAKQFSVAPSHNDGESPILLDHEFERMHISTTVNHDGCIDASSTNPTESQFSVVPTGHKIESFQPSTCSSSSVFPSFDTHHGATHQQVLDPQQIRPVTVFALPDLEALELDMREMPPLPPLPPIQWRIGKLQNSSLAPEGKMVQPTVSPLSPVTADEETQWCLSELDGELAQPLNPFLPFSVLKDEELLHGSLIGREMEQPSLNPFSSLAPIVGDEKINHDFITLERKTAQPLNPFFSSASENENPLDYSLDLGANMLQPSPKPFAPSPTNEDIDGHHPSLNLDDEKVKQDLFTLERKTAQPLNPFITSSIEDEKPQNCSIDLGESILQPCTNSFAPSPTNEEVNAQNSSQDLDDLKIRHDVLALERNAEESLNPDFSSAIENEKAQHSSLDVGVNRLSPSYEDVNAQNSSQDLDDWKIRHDVLALERNAEESLNPDFSSAIENEKAQHSSLDVGVNRLSPSYEDVNAQLSSLDLEEHVLHSLNLLPPIPDIEDETTRDTSLDLEGEHVQYLDLLERPVTTEDEESPRTIEDEEPQYGSLSLDEEITWQSDLCAMLPVEQYGKPSGSFLKRLNRPRDPLIEAVASHDKSTLRRVTERVQPQTGEKVDERDSLLQQIRAKSFNLKPAVVTRPSIQGPKTNMKVNAILEKANAIRQALAGSDEDDDSESWSDS